MLVGNPRTMSKKGVQEISSLAKLLSPFSARHSCAEKGEKSFLEVLMPPVTLVCGISTWPWGSTSGW